MNLRQLYLTKNNCYIAGRTITPKGIMVHSTGANNPNLKRYVGPDDGLLGVNSAGNHWNQPTPDNSQICVHAFIGKLADGSITTYQTLPWNHRGWHCGKSGNDTHISFEICEDGLTDATYFSKVYQEAVELCAYLCNMYGLDPLADGVLICHSEGYTRGIASNHSDVLHWFPKHGKTMDDFRKAVKVALDSATTSSASSGSTYSTDDTLYRVQVGAYSKQENAEAIAVELKAKGYDTYMVIDNLLFKVQTGAYADKKNAEAMAAKLKVAGFETYITIKSGTAVSSGTTSTGAIVVGSKVKVKSGAKTYDGDSLASFVYTTIYDVIQIEGNRVVIGIGKSVTAAMNMADLIKVSGTLK